MAAHRNDDVSDIFARGILGLLTRVLELVGNELFDRKRARVVVLEERHAALRIRNHCVDKTLSVLDAVLVLKRFACYALEIRIRPLRKSARLESDA